MVDPRGWCPHVHVHVEWFGLHHGLEPAHAPQHVSPDANAADTSGSAYGLQQGASGAYDSYFLELAQEMVAGGQGDSIVRPGWEFNGSWFPWAANGQAAAFVGYWQQIVQTMRSVPGGNFKFEWNPTAGDQGAGNLAAFYPGSAYVDYIGLDVYDQTWATYAGISSEWNTYLTETYGLNWLAWFAASEGKPITLPEWGLDPDPSSNDGGTIRRPTPKSVAVTTRRSSMTWRGGSHRTMWSMPATGTTTRASSAVHCLICRKVVHSVVVFTGEAEFKSDLSSNVLHLAGLIPFLTAERPVVFDERKMTYIVGRIEMKRERRSLETDEYHINHVRDRLAGRECQNLDPRAFSRLRPAIPLPQAMTNFSRRRRSYADHLQIPHSNYRLHLLA